MNVHLVAGLLLLLTPHHSFAQEPSGRLDLDLVAALPYENLVAARVVFDKVNVTCPHDYATIRLGNGGLLHQRVMVQSASMPTRWQGFGTIDDYTYRSHIATADCRRELTVRLQVRELDGSWRSLLVAPDRRPGLSAADRHEMTQRSLEEFRARPRPEPEVAARQQEAQRALTSMGSLAQGVLVKFSEGTPFENAPPTCADGYGTVVTEQDGVTLLFTTKLSDTLNRFVMERVDPGDGESRIYFTRGDCRLELTITAATQHDGRWVARTIPAHVPPRNR